MNLSSSRKHFLLYLILSAFFLALLVWWIYYQVREGERITTQQEAVWEREIAVAHHWLEEHLTDCEAFRVWLAATYPDLELTELGVVAVRTEARGALRETAGRRVRMFASEGSVLILLLIAAVTYVYWTLRKEILLERRQSTFLSATSHELKTPLTSLRLYLDTLRDRKLSEEKQKEVFEIMGQDLTRLSNQIDELLQAQAVMGKRRVVLEEIELAKETEAALAQDRVYYERQGFELRMKLEAGLSALADSRQWQLVVKNLVENAVKYSGEARVVEVKLSHSSGRAKLEVTDFGIGIEHAELKRIFDSFYRIGNEDTRSTQGTGLGLFLVRAIVKSFKGTVMAASSGLGRGAIFTVELPLIKDAGNA
ncbi:HAMP domain-containing histidine kinase [bacterium]|nr:HAMP domain-containing histidine kinase [bacterium]MBU1638111.1 HAMP domain-containing histidine kinase [bacterium]